MSNEEIYQKLLKKLRGDCGDYTKYWIDEEILEKQGGIIIIDAPDGEKYQLLKCLGHGFEGEVWKVKELSTGAFYAIKFEIGDVEIGSQLKAEYDILLNLDHPQIIKPYKYWCGPMYEYDIERGHMLTHYCLGKTFNKTRFFCH
jgi:serine/threonine protein kinase